MEDSLLLKFIVIIAAFVGLYAARVIAHHKTTGKKLVCPLDSDCEAVVHSKYSVFLGIPLERMGSAYYIFVIALNVFLLFWPDLFPFLLQRFFIGMSISAFFFSLYLTGLQLFKIKEWCAWCLVSAGMCFVIFISTLFAYGGSLFSN
jgi:uncharacterized membrane protein